MRTMVFVFALFLLAACEAGSGGGASDPSGDAGGGGGDAVGLHDVIDRPDTAAPRVDTPAPPRDGGTPPPADVVAPPADVGPPTADVPAADVAPPPCPESRERCGGVCVDTSSDPRHCGGCDEACDPGGGCRDRVCEALADCRTDGCPGFTYCDEATGTCLLGCDRREQCVAYADCDLATHECVCDAGYHDCDGVCVSDDDPAHCGGRCTPCPSDPNGAATCSGTQCGLLCDSGHHLCGGACVADDDRDHCGSSCTPCPDVANGIATCDGTSCGFACDLGYHACGDECVANDDVDHCGDRCTPCPQRANASVSCSFGLQCFYLCDAGYHDCDDVCVPDDDTAHCGTSCAPCPDVANGAATCDGRACGFVCDAGYHPCDGGCVADDATAHCGDRCDPCPTDPNGVAVCEGGACGLVCDDGFRLCGGACAACPDAAGALGFDCAGGACVITGCEVGHHPVGDACVAWRNEAFIQTDEYNGGIGFAFSSDGEHANVCFSARSSLYGTLTCRYWHFGGTGYRRDALAQNPSSNYAALAVADSTYPRVAYTQYETGGSYQVYYSTLSPYTGGVSDYLIGPAGYGSDFSVAIDGADLARVSYVMGGTLYHAWQEQSLGPFTAAVVEATGYNSDTATAVTPDDESLVAHVCDGGDVCLYRTDGGPAAGGAIEVVAESDAMIATGTALAVAADGTIHLAWYDADARELWLATSGPDGGGGWDRQLVQEGGGGGPSLALDPQGRPCLAYLVGSYPATVRFAAWDGAAWRRSRVDPDGNAEEIRQPHLRFDAAGRAHVIYRDGSWVSQRSVALD